MKWKRQRIVSKLTVNTMDGIDLMITCEYGWDAENKRHTLIVNNCSGYEATQILAHPAIDRSQPCYFNPPQGHMECWLKDEYARNVHSIHQALDWIEEEALSAFEPIQHDWSWYLDMLVATKD